MAKGIGSNTPRIYFGTQTGTNWKLEVRPDFDLDALAFLPPKHDCPFCQCKGDAPSQT